MFSLNNDHEFSSSIYDCDTKIFLDAIVFFEIILGLLIGNHTHGSPLYSYYTSTV